VTEQTLSQILKDAETRMGKAVEVARDDFAGIRTGRAHPAMFAKITAEYYGTPTPIQQLASFQIPEPRVVVVSAYDKNSVTAIEKAIRDSDLGVSPANDGNVLRLVLPELKGKLDGTAIRIPTPNVSLISLDVNLKAEGVTKEIVNQAMKEASEGELAGILGYSTAPLVSVDFNHDPRSSVFDSTQTQVVDGALVRVMSWYDNEWGFSNRMLDLSLIVAGKF